MIIYYHWKIKRVLWDGWFLLGILPLYLRRINPDVARYHHYGE